MRARWQAESEGAGLLGPLPDAPVRSQEHRLGSAAPEDELFKMLRGLVGERDVARFAALALADMDRAHREIDVCDLEPDELPVTRSCEDCGSHERPELRIAGVDEPLAFGAAEIPNAGDVDAAEGRHTAPGLVGGDAVFGKAVVQRRLEDGEHAVGPGPPPAHGFGIRRIEPRLLRAGCDSGCRE